MPSIVETPAGVILLTLSEPKFAVYIFPEVSMVMPPGVEPVIPSMVETPETRLSERTEVYLKRLAVEKLKPPTVLVANTTSPFAFTVRNLSVFVAAAEVESSLSRRRPEVLADAA